MEAKGLRQRFLKPSLRHPIYARSRFNFALAEELDPEDPLSEAKPR